MSTSKNILKLTSVLGYCSAALLVQQVLMLWFALKNIIPSGMAKQSYKLRHGQITLDHERTISIFDLPLAGKGMLIGSLAGIGILFLAVLMSRDDFRKSFAFQSPNWRTSLPWLVAFLIAGILFAWLEQTFPAFRSDAMMNMIMASSHQPLLTILGAGIAVPLFEEFFFRGVLFGHLERMGNGAVAVVATSVVFALLHAQYQLPLMLGILCVGVLLGILRWRSGSIWPGVIVHVANNTIAVLLMMNSTP